MKPCTGSRLCDDWYRAEKLGVEILDEKKFLELIK